MAAGQVGGYARGSMVFQIGRARPVRISPRAGEWLVVGGFAVWGVLEQLLGEHSVPVPVGLMLLIPVLVPLLMCRRHPLGAAVVLGVCAPVRAALGGAAYPDVTPLQICVVVVWAQGKYARRLTSAAAGAVIAVAGVLASMGIAEARRPDGNSALILGAVFFACVMAAGVFARRQSEEARTERTARHAVELERERRVREAVVAERSRIARELHDLVAHGVAAISILAGVAKQWLERDPARAESALRNARRRARTVLAEMRRLLSVLRDDEPATGGAVAAAGHTAGIEASKSLGDTWPSFLADGVPAIAVLLYGAIELASVPASASAVARLLGIAAFGVAVFVRRVAPLPAAAAFALVLILRAADGQLGHASRSATLALLILGWSLGSGVIGWAARVAALAVLEVGVAVALGFAERRAVPTDFVVLGLLPLAAVGAGSVVRRWRAEAEVERARVREVAAERELHSQRAVSRERALVARELHDVVAHAVSIISVQAGAAESLVGRDRARARRSIEAVLAAAHQALAELRRLLDLLSAEDNPRADYLPQPGLANLDELVANARDVSLEVQLIDERSGGEPPAGVQLAAFRIVQEALTNAQKHGALGPVIVRLMERPGELEVEIGNRMASTATTGSGTGHGLVGMRERVRLYDGHLDAGPDGDGRWRVRAVLPVESEAA